ncbi:CRISPR system precrRNA processing endoribonuclease RAMP protein Cas6 [Roseateles sp. DXS20W]|uniref:CRISPR system precrRNA processing endoribonuclease RAMP protein Cas6 n=1 Tax=Pelomonas lactea TaxID=3299030 RepID=A0ABW7GP89_9BURK
MTPPDRPRLAGLAWVRLACRLEFDAPVSGMPDLGWGALLRGSFGRALFATAPVSAELFMGGQTADDAVRPWWLSAHPLAADGADGIRAVDACWTLVGPAIPRLPDVARAIEDMGMAGLGRERMPARLREAAAAEHVDADQLWMQVSASPAISAAEPLEVRADSPWRVKHRNQWLRQAMPMDVLLLACLARLSAVRRVSGIAAEAPLIDAAARRAWLDRAAAWAPRAEDTRVAQAPRWSARQARQLPLSGLVGSWRYDAPARVALPWLALAQQLHLGSKTTLGFGQLRLASARDAG